MLEFGKSRFGGRENSAVAEKVEAVSERDMAVIGMALKMPMANTPEEFWNNLKQGRDCVGGLSEARRRDSGVFLRNMGMEPALLDKSIAAFLNEVDKFDCGFFKISPNEANLMEPSQRMFLETAWAALEDAGYGGNCLYGSRTGVFVGYGSDPDYKKLLDVLEPDAVSLGMIGNTRPVIASRLSYLMDFRGPSLLVDTTCSSSLMAIHLAVRAIRNGECEQAIAGAVQLHLIPVRKTKIGIEASGGRARTFDDSSDGTGTGEGLGAILIKPLHRAIRDRDNIYAVIKGSAANHDGASNGMTAPNPLAQEDVIVSAWQDARVDPETITYIETHGTGTKLGDPIEIDGITRAFKRFTGRKSFCAMGAVKTNIGHLDSAAGMAGFIKAVLSLKHGELLPNYSFKRPNRNIPFEDTPVYVSSSAAPWETEGGPRRCGVSSFGISGTNLHVVLEQAPERKQEKSGRDVSSLKAAATTAHFLTLSAKSSQALVRLAKAMADFIDGKEQDMDLAGLCYTLNTGRGHYQHRLALVFDSLSALSSRLKRLAGGTMAQAEALEDTYYGEFRIAPPGAGFSVEKDITVSRLKQLSQEALEVVEVLGGGGCRDGEKQKELFKKLGTLYISGAEVNLGLLYKEAGLYRQSLPTYPFEARRHWIELKPKNLEDAAELPGKRYFKAAGLEAYRCTLSPNSHWMLSEHRIMGDCVLVGTTFLEMAIRACKSYLKDNTFEIADVLFLQPLILKDNEERTVQTVIRKVEGFYEFSVESLIKADNSGNQKEEEQWRQHVEGKIYPQLQPAPYKKVITVEALKKKYEDSFMIPDIEEYSRQSVFSFGERWNNMAGIYPGEEELLTLLKMPLKYQGELEDYTFHPALMDNAVATMPLLQKIFSSGIYQGDKGIFLPFSYKSIKLYSPFPVEFYSHVRLKGALQPDSEIAVFDMDFADVEGRVFAQIEGYTLKKASVKAPSMVIGKMLHEICWVPFSMSSEQSTENGMTVLLFKDRGGYGEMLAEKLRNLGTNLIEVQKGSSFERLSHHEYIVGHAAGDYEKLFKVLDSEGVGVAGRTEPFKLVQLSPLDGDRKAASLESLNYAVEDSLMEVFMTAKALLSGGSKCREFVVVTRNAYSILPEDREVSPVSGAVVGLAKVIEQEGPGLRTGCIDIDDNTAVGEVAEDILRKVPLSFTLAHRKGTRLVEQLKELDAGKAVQPNTLIKENGIYVVAGGTGGIGLAVAKGLAEKCRVRLVLISRSEITQGEAGQKLPEEGKDRGRRLKRRLEGIREIEALGSQVILYRADIADEEEMTKVFEDIHRRLGRVQGVIHSAGVAGDGFILKKDAQAFRAGVAVKIQGTWLLDRLTREDRPDFLLLFSSNNVLMGIPGQSDYTAANGFLNSYAVSRSLETGMRTTCISWPAWKEAGMAYDHGVAADGIFKAISTRAGVEVFNHTLSRELINIHVGEVNPGGAVMGRTIGDLRLLLPEGGRYGTAQSENHRDKPEPAKGNREVEKPENTVILRGGKAEEFGRTEHAVASVWQQVLGFEEINVQDDFFDIGGDSILITRVHSLLEGLYPGSISVSDLFTETTIAQIAGYIKRTYPEDTEEKPHKEKNDKETAEAGPGLGIEGSKAVQTEPVMLEHKILELIAGVEGGQLDIEEAVKSFEAIG